jgi:hypothetical protein
MSNVSHSGNNHKEARSNSQPYINCKVSSVNEDNKAADLFNPFLDGTHKDCFPSH